MQPASFLRRTVTALALGAVAGLLPLVSAGAAHADDIPGLNTPQVAYDGTSRPAKGVAARGTDGALLYAARSGDGFAPFRSLGGVIVGDPSATATPNGVELYARGTDDRVYLNTITPSGAATGYSVIPGLAVTGEVESVMPRGEPVGTVRLFARGQDGAVWTNVRRNGSWVGWTSLGGFVTSDILATRQLLTAANVRIFVRGSDNRVYFTEIGPNGFSGFKVAGDLRVTSNLAGVEDFPINAGEVFARGEDNRVYRYLVGRTWEPVTGVTATSDIAVSTRTLYVRGPDNAIYANPRSILDNSFLGFRRVSGEVTGNPAAFALQPNGGPETQFLLARQPSGALGLSTGPQGGPYGGYTPIAGANVG